MATGVRLTVAIGALAAALWYLRGPSVSASQRGEHQARARHPGAQRGAQGYAHGGGQRGAP